MASRDLQDLKPHMAERVQALQQRAREAGLDLLIYCTLRSFREQAQLFRQSRPPREIRAKAEQLQHEFGRPDLASVLMDVGPQHGPHVTNAAPGESLHGYALAFDGVPMRGGKPVWGTEDPEDRRLWDLYGELAVTVGLEWAGNWTSFREFPHCQDPDASWRDLIHDGVP